MRNLFVLLLLGCSPCASSSEYMKWTDTDQAFRSELLRLIPIGTEVSAAKKIMDRNGFSVNESSGPFAGIRDDLKGKPFLYCDRERSAGFLISRRYQATLVFENHKVIDIAATTGLIGP
ncbi:MAG: hypothetical protein JNM63_17605 [Spirochaetia bacterium]|nr:hypothetical protein [Spirochaetia bacterium]